MSGWTDAHNHLHDPRLGGDPRTTLAQMQAAGVRRCVVNATREEDWHPVAELARDFPDTVIPAFGIHPWQAHTAESGWETRLESLLRKFPHSTIGECGLDRWVTHPAMEIQMPVLLAQLRIARSLDRPLTIHCLRAWDALFHALEIEAAPPRFLLHSFGGSAETAQRLAKLGAFFSISGHFLLPRKAAAWSTLRQLPADRILIETDAPDMAPPPDLQSHPLANGANHPANLPLVAAETARRLGMSTMDFARTTSANTNRWLGT